jgi:hypothetical protein
VNTKITQRIPSLPSPLFSHQATYLLDVLFDITSNKNNANKNNTEIPFSAKNIENDQ